MLLKAGVLGWRQPLRAVAWGWHQLSMVGALGLRQQLRAAAWGWLLQMACATHQEASLLDDMLMYYDVKKGLHHWCTAP